MTPIAETPGQGQESVWSYPRPAVAEPVSHHIHIAHRGVTLADSRSCIRTLETSHPPSYYVPPADVALTLLRPSGRRSFCEWKGHASYFDVVIGNEILRDVAWTYPDPTGAFAGLRDHIAFYAEPFDSCTVDDKQVIPQPGGFYGGWITSHVVGPFKGVPGSAFW